MRRVLSFKKLNKGIAFVLVTAMLVMSGFCEFKYINTKASESVGDRVGNPSWSGNVSTWDCVYFGHYNQTRKKDTNQYYKEPIKWRVLEKANGQLFLLADQSLDSMQYNESDKTDLTWEHSDLRAWLNDDFYNEAFDSYEQEDIMDSEVTADPCLNKTSVKQGNDTVDKVYVLSQLEATLEGYGFVDNHTASNSASNTRCSVNGSSEEAYPYRRHFNKSGTAEFNNGIDGEGFDKGNILSKSYDCYYNCGIWWLRTVSGVSGQITRIDYDGSVTKTKPPKDRNACVRPVIHVDQDSDLLRYAGTVSSNGNESNYCGEDATIQYDLENGVLTISGSGPMYSFKEYEAPWHKYYEFIDTVVIDGNVSSISSNAFEDCANITYLYINDHVTSIAQDAFSDNSMNEDLLVSVKKGSDAETRCDLLNWNYTDVRSKKSLPIAISEIRNTIHSGNTVTFNFKNPCAGQSYEVSLDGELVETITDDVDNPEPTIYVTVTGVTEGTHVIKVNSLVEGSKTEGGVRYARRSKGKIIRVNDDGFDDPEWDEVIEDKVTWDVVEFGRYPQKADPNGDYEEEGVTYKTEPIKWRILHIDHDAHTMLLMADQSLDNKPFDTNKKTEWSTSSLRAWLNDEDTGFISRAFNDEEKEALKVYSTGTGLNDKVFSLKKTDCQKHAYGFSTSEKASRTRRSNATDYCGRNNDPSAEWPTVIDIATWHNTTRQKVPYDPTDNYHKRATIWWLAEKVDSNNARRINYHGNTNEGKAPGSTNACVRPFILIDTKSKAINDGGTIDSYGETSDPANYYNVTIDDKDPIKVKEGETFTLPANNTKTRSAENAVMGYIDDEDTSHVYKPLSSFSIDRDRSFKTIHTLTAEAAGTAIKINPTKDHALGFQCKMQLNGGDVEQTEGFEYGVLVTTYNDYDNIYHGNVGIDTKEVPGHKIYNVKFGNGAGCYPFATGSGQAVIVGIGNLKQQNYDREFIAKPYCIIHYQGDATEDEVIYPENPLNIKSAAERAQEYINDPNYKKRYPKQQQRTFIESYTKKG